MTEERIPWIIMAHASPYRVARNVPGTIAIRANCGHTVWSSPSTVEYMKTAEGARAYTQCTMCHDRDRFDDDEPVIAHVPGSQEELASVGVSQAQMDQILAHIRRHKIGDL